MAEKRCLSCGKTDSDSLRILAAYLCGECESKLVRSDPAAADYRHWVAVCRRLWERGIPTELTKTKE
jgi:hypothetical protein